MRQNSIQHIELACLYKTYHHHKISYVIKYKNIHGSEHLSTQRLRLQSHE